MLLKHDDEQPKVLGTNPAKEIGLKIPLFWLCTLLRILGCRFCPRLCVFIAWLCSISIPNHSLSSPL